MRRVVSTVKRGDSFIGRVIKDSSIAKHIIEIEMGGKIIKTEEGTLDEEESEMKLTSVMDATYRAMTPPHPQSRRKG